MRVMNEALLAAFAAPVVWPVLLVELAFTSGVVRAHSLLTPLIMADPLTGAPLEFQGVGDLGRVSAIEQPDGLRASDAEVEVTGLDPVAVARSLNEDYQGLSARIFLSAMSGGGLALAGQGGVTLLRGRMDVMRIDLGASASIAVSIRNELADWERPVGLLYSDAGQRRLFANDTGLAGIAFAAENVITWQV